VIILHNVDIFKNVFLSQLLEYVYITQYFPFLLVLLLYMLYYLLV